MSIEPAKRRLLLEELVTLKEQSGGEDRTTFLPLAAHRLALREEALVIHGPRGCGKSKFFRLLMDTKSNSWVLDLLGVPRTHVKFCEGFSEHSLRHLTVEALEKFPSRDMATLRLMWVTHLACRLIEEGHAEAGELRPIYEIWRGDRARVDAWVAETKEKSAAVLAWLDRVDRGLTTEIIVLYDHVDRIGVREPAARRAFSSALVGLWLSLMQRYRRLRAKIFLSDVQHESAKSISPYLPAHSVPLAWDQQSLYRLLLRRMGDKKELRAWLQNSEFPVKWDAGVGCLPPDPLPEEGPVSQRTLGERLIGVVLVEGLKQSFTYRFLIFRLQDAKRRVVPSSLLNLLAIAAQDALKKGPRALGAQLLTQSEVLSARRVTAERRIGDLIVEYPAVARLRTLEDRSVPMRQETLRGLLSSADIQDGFGSDGAAVCDELVRCGVLIQVRHGARGRHDAECSEFDLPDLYVPGIRGLKRSLNPQ